MYLTFAPSELIIKTMCKEETEQRIEYIKKLMGDYIRLAPGLGVDKKTEERMVDMFLEDLQRELKKLEKYNSKKR